MEKGMAASISVDNDIRSRRTIEKGMAIFITVDDNVKLRRLEATYTCSRWSQPNQQWSELSEEEDG